MHVTSPQSPTAMRKAWLYRRQWQGRPQPMPVTMPRSCSTPLQVGVWYGVRLQLDLSLGRPPILLGPISELFGLDLHPLDVAVHCRPSRHVALALSLILLNDCIENQWGMVQHEIAAGSQIGAPPSLGWTSHITSHICLDPPCLICFTH